MTVPAPTPPRVDAAALRTAVAAVFRAVDVPEGDAALVADALVSAELRGVTTHGVANLGPRYLQWVEEGFVNAAPAWRVVRGRAAAVNIDGDRGLGIVVAARAMGLAIERARETGACVATVHNSRHLGMAAYHAMLALPHGMIGTCSTAVRSRMVPTFGREPRLGTNPIAIAVPAGEEPAFVFDAATTTVASNVLRLAERAGTPVAGGLLVDADGRPVREPMVPREPYRLAPLGGTPEGASYKGYGLAAAVDILTGVLSQATAAGTFAPGVAAHHLMALDVDALLPIEEFRAGMDAFLRRLTATPPAPGHDEVLVAGLREHRAEQAHLREGIPLPQAAVAWLMDAHDRFGLSRPSLDRGRVTSA